MVEWWLSATETGGFQYFSQWISASVQMGERLDCFFFSHNYNWVLLHLSSFPFWFLCKDSLSKCQTQCCDTQTLKIYITCVSCLGRRMQWYLASGWNIGLFVPKTLFNSLSHGFLVFILFCLLKQPVTPSWFSAHICIPWSSSICSWCSHKGLVGMHTSVLHLSSTVQYFATHSEESAVARN